MLSYSRGADIHAKDKWKHTPLLTAAAHGKKDAIECLRERLDKHYLNQVDGDGKSALFLTVEAGHNLAVNVSLLHFRWGTYLSQRSMLHSL